MKFEVKHNRDMGMGHYGWDIYGLKVWLWLSDHRMTTSFGPITRP